MSWTEDRVSLLTKLWGEGHTAAEIAKKLGGVTRNAVIGKAHRLKLSNRVSPIQQNKKAANNNTENTRNRSVTALKALEKVRPEKDKTLKTGKDFEKTNAKDLPLPKENSDKKEVAALAGKLHSLMELKPRQCRWPSGDPKESSFGFCGELAMTGLPYCAEHAKIAYQATTRNRIFGAEKQSANQENAKKQAGSKT